MTDRWRLHRDGSVSIDGEIIGRVAGQARNWGFVLADYRDPGRTKPNGWFSKRDAAGMCARAHQEIPPRQELCPGGCGCRLGTEDADARECGCDGPCTGESESEEEL